MKKPVKKIAATKKGSALKNMARKLGTTKKKGAKVASSKSTGTKVLFQAKEKRRVPIAKPQKTHPYPSGNRAAERKTSRGRDSRNDSQQALPGIKAAEATSSYEREFDIELIIKIRPKGKKFNTLCLLVDEAPGSAVRSRLEMALRDLHNVAAIEGQLNNPSWEEKRRLEREAAKKKEREAAAADDKANAKKARDTLNGPVRVSAVIRKVAPKLVADVEKNHATIEAPKIASGASTKDSVIAEAPSGNL